MLPTSNQSTKKARATSPDSLSALDEGLASGSGGNIIRNGRIASTSMCNQGRLLALPHELIAMILSYFPEIPLEYILSNARFVNKAHSPDFNERFEVLRSLSQTCRLFRKIYLPLLWERFQVCLAPNTGGWFSALGKALKRKSEGMLKSPHLWPYVRVVTVSISQFQTHTVLPPFVELLRALPEVHTIEIPYANPAITTAFKTAFEGNRFPTIRKVIMPTCAHEILRCCPSVEEVTCNEGGGGRLVGALLYAGCSKLEVIRDLSPGSGFIKRLIKANPPLRHIGISTRLEYRTSMVKVCAAFPSVRVLEISSAEGEDVGHLVMEAQDALRGSEPKNAQQTRKLVWKPKQRRALLARATRFTFGP